MKDPNGVLLYHSCFKMNSIRLANLSAKAFIIQELYLVSEFTQLRMWYSQAKS